ncbi:hypothetical protein E2C01_014002 [Portunus trituberculatus]|uniref:Uncharacterized protein n=1 Tax=Portunus trituberculatus TaxID=210409 RepID=A0A5B7DIZ5_PORTR|nr:hypothetical protein [Portunus trituberculatus]
MVSVVFENSRYEGINNTKAVTHDSFSSCLCLCPCCPSRVSPGSWAHFTAPSPAWEQVWYMDEGASYIEFIR